jgi:hypothetical protein
MLRNVVQGFKWGSIGLSGRKFRSSLRSSPDSGGTLPKIVETSNVPVYVFSSQPVEDEAMEQLKNLANSDIPVGYVAAMPGNILFLFPFPPFLMMGFRCPCWQGSDCWFCFRQRKICYSKCRWCRYWMWNDCCSLP